MDFPVLSLAPFETKTSPNLLAGGSYDDQLRKIQAFASALKSYIESNPSGYVLPQATQTELGGVYLVGDDDFKEYMGV